MQHRVYGRWSSCNDVDKCGDGAHNCDRHVVCGDLAGSFSCICNTGYSGNGVTCSNDNQCVTNTHNCAGNASCGDIGLCWKTDTPRPH
eukprot:1046807-Rhodomonas_salina.1